MQAFSPVGRCKTFDASADGYGRGEGCAVISMKPQAAADGDEPGIAVVRSSAINQDGRSSGLTAPNGPSQTALIRSAAAIAGKILLLTASASVRIPSLHTSRHLLDLQYGI